ncbi:MAG: peptidoglycan-associated lipoprotein Pal [Rhodobacteraceae bacterium]|nr:peptidoglycan-associated lipoprotein Pal [Paracoccaceae bacterium]MCY4195367.1 peptidoglycan-associated lipoprotein Pal [Paracoccaceae bacterium]
MKLKVMVSLVSLAALVACSGDVLDTGVAGNASGGLGSGGGIGQAELQNYEPDSPEYFTELIGNTVYFEVDQSVISEDSAAVLRQQAQWLNQNTEYSVLVEGHADEQGTREYNLALGARRAAAVKSFLTDLGVADIRLATVTYGKERPVAVCSSETCWSKNRRSVSVVERESGG